MNFTGKFLRKRTLGEPGSSGLRISGLEEEAAVEEQKLMEVAYIVH
jgi:hypothetical protein